MRIGRYLQRHDCASGYVDDDSAQRCDDRVPGHRVLPSLELWVARLRPDQICLTDIALILLEGCDPARVGRPENDGVMGVLPSGVVSGVAEISRPVGSE